MQRGRGGRDDFLDFNDPFAGFGGFGGQRNLIPSIFGGRDPFDDPFFNRPFGSGFGSSIFGPSMFGPSMFGPRGSLFGEPPATEFIDHEPPQAGKSQGPVIRELNSDDEEVDEEDEQLKASEENVGNSKKHPGSSKEPYVEYPDDEAEGKKGKRMQYRSHYDRADGAQPQVRTSSFQSSTVTYGGVDGAYYTSSTNRRTGSDGVILEESKQADTRTGQASHRLSKGLNEKGHSVTRKLNPDGKVDTMQTLHNLSEDELAGFEESWKGNANIHIPGWNEGFNMHANIGTSGSRPFGQWALPTTGQQQSRERMGFNDGFRSNTSDGGARSSRRINID